MYVCATFKFNTQQVTTDPRFGRLQENFAEDPMLVAAYGVAALRGLQGDDGRGDYHANAGGAASTYIGSPQTHVSAQAKHYAACSYIH